MANLTSLVCVCVCVRCVPCAGGVLSHGLVQEEIRFSVCPECLPSLLFFPVMAPTEAIIITGVQQFAKYSGYSMSFRYNG